MTLCLLTTGLAAFSQQHMPNRVNTYTDEGPGTGFQKENLFMGGSLNLSFGSYDFNVRDISRGLGVFA